MKLPYEYVSKHVELLYQRQFEPNQIEDINYWCDFIIEYIESCGWNVEEYVEVMWQDFRSNYKLPGE